MISAPRIVVFSVTFFPMGLFYSSSDNGADYTNTARNPTAASAMKGSPPISPELWGLSSNGTEMYAKGVDRYLPEMRLRRIQE